MGKKWWILEWEDDGFGCCGGRIFALGRMLDGVKGAMDGSGEVAWGECLRDGIGLRKDGGEAVEDWQLIACEWNA